MGAGGVGDNVREGRLVGVGGAGDNVRQGE